jgi:YVTN family beta-propeller protein
MKAPSRRLWLFPLAAAGLILSAWLLLHIIVPSPTVLVVSAVDAETEAPLAGASVQVQAQSAQPLPIATTDVSGVVRFENIPPDPAYSIRVQKVDYDLAVEFETMVQERQETYVTVSLTSHAGGRLFAGLDTNSITEIDTASLLIVQTVHVPGRDGSGVSCLLAHPTEDLLYAIVGVGGYILDSQSGAQLASLEIKNPDQIPGWVERFGLSKDGQRLFAVSTWNRGSLTILDSHTGQLLMDTILIKDNASQVGMLAHKSGSVRMFVIQNTSEGLSVKDLEAFAERELDDLTILFGFGTTLSLDEACEYYWRGPMYYGQADRLSEELRIRKIDVRPTREFTHTLPAGTSTLAISPNTGEVCVLNSTLGTLTILDATGQEMRAVVPVGKQPETLVIGNDGLRAYIGNRKSKTISVIDLLSAHVVHTIPLPGGPISLVLK